MSEIDKRVIVLSDATGETAHLMVKAALVQFPVKVTNITRYKNVRSKEQIKAICGDAAQDKCLIIHTIVSPKLRHYLSKNAEEASVPCVDLLGPLLLGLARHFNLKPQMSAGLLHGVNETYFMRIEAMEYTIKHDDGRDLTGLEEADLIILGISRTSKTPISMYLSHQGWKVANIPLIDGYSIPPELEQIDPRKIIGLTIEAESLTTIRRNRLMRLGQEQGGDYAEMNRVYEEVEYANEIFRKNRRWAVFDVTGKAIEETASEIIKLMVSRRLVPIAAEGLVPSTLPSRKENAKKRSH